jgi:hypothetical protein
MRRYVAGLVFLSTFIVHGAAATDAHRVSLWDLPGLRVVVTSDCKNGFCVQKTDPAKVDPAQRADLGFDLIYPGITSVRLEIKANGDK